MSPVPPAVAATSEPTSRRAVFLPAPLTTWQETWRWLVTVTASLLLLVVGSSNAAFAGRSLGLDVLLGVVAFGAFAVRRRWPLLAGAVACLAGSQRGLLQERQRARPECLAGSGERHAAAVALEQARAHVGFELLDGQRQRRLRHGQPLRGAAEVQLFGQHGETAQVTEFH